MAGPRLQCPACGQETMVIGQEGVTDWRTGDVAEFQIADQECGCALTTDQENEVIEMAHDKLTAEDFIPEVVHEWE